MLTVTTREDFLKEVAKHLPTDSRYAELGVLHGDFSEMIFKFINPKHLCLIDPYETGKRAYGDGQPTAYSTEQDYANLINRFEIEIISAQVSVNRKYSYNAVHEYPKYFFDFIYIDGCHLYECVKQDLNDWFVKVKPKALICGHDMGLFGVTQAVDEFLLEHNLELLILNKNGGDWAFMKL